MWAIDSCHSHSTYGCDDSSSKEEGTTKIPVAGVVGGITNGIHPGIHSLHRMLGREVDTETHKKSLVSLWLLRIMCYCALDSALLELPILHFSASAGFAVSVDAVVVIAAAV